MPTNLSRIYLDNAATSYPKSPAVGRGMVDALSLQGSSGRSAHAGALEASRLVFRARKRIADFLGVETTENILFQPGCTQAANLVLKGYLHSGDQILVSSTEHNSITRPLYELAQIGVEITWIPVDESGVVDLNAAQALLTAGEYKAVVCMHGSNVSGAIQPIQELAARAHACGAAMIVDGAQAGGHLPVDLGTLGADAWFCSGHKGFGGPSGIGVLYLASDFVVPPLITGGTGSGGRDYPADPLERPDAYEAGTAPLPALGGLSTAIEELATTADQRRKNEQARTAQLHEGLSVIRGVRVLGPARGEPRLPILSITSDAIAPDALAARLDMEFGIAVRAGVHCAPTAHEALGTGGTGAVRFSPGYSTTPEEIDLTIAAVAKIIDDEAGSAGMPS